MKAKIKALVVAFPGCRKQLIQYVEKKGFETKMTGTSSFEFTGAGQGVVLMLTELRHKYPVAYVNGWTLGQL